LTSERIRLERRGGKTEAVVRLERRMRGKTGAVIRFDQRARQDGGVGRRAALASIASCSIEILSL
jgi:hypothetical protein